MSADERFCANCGSRLPEQTEQPAAVPPTTRLGDGGAEPTQALPPLTLPPADNQPGPRGPSLAPPGLPSNLPPAPAQKSGGMPKIAGCPIWAIILVGIFGFCIIAAVVSIGILSLLGQRVSAVFSEINSGLMIEEITVESGGIIDLPTTISDEPTVEAEPEPAPTSAGSGGIIGGVAGGAASQAQTVQAATAEAGQVVAVEQTALAGTAEIEQLFAGAREVFKDEFVDNRNGWFTGVFQEIETDLIEDGVFKVIWAGEGSSYELYELREIPSFIAEVDCLIAQGGVDGSCGLVFAQKDDVGFYKYELFEDYYRLFVVGPEGDPPILIEGSPEGIIRPGDWNRLRVIKRGEEIRIYLNGVLLDTVSDSTYATGKVGVSTNSYLEAGGVEVHFDNFIIWELPS